MKTRGIWAMGMLLAWGAALPLPAEEAHRAKTTQELFRELPATYGDALVTVRFLNQVNMPGVNREIDREAQCLMIESTGTVLCSSSEIGGHFGVMARLLGRSTESISSRPRDVKVMLPGKEQEELEARLVARDSDRDLAWVVLKDPEPDRRFVHLDITENAVADVGDTAYLLRRLDRYFGKKAVVSEFHVTTLLERPRPLYLASWPLGYLGQPVFDRQGRFLGLTIVQVPREGEGESVMGNRGLPGQAGPVDDMIGTVILPAADIVKATRLARETWEADE